MKKKILINLILCIAFFYSEAQLRVGDPGVTFDQSKRDPNYPQMAEWETAGVRGGIPFIDQLDIKLTLNPTNSAGIQSAIDNVARQGGGAILLKNGTYNINLQVNMKSKVILVGESREGVICQVDRDIDRRNKNSGINDHHKDPKPWDDGNGVFKFENTSFSGIYRLTINGGWGTPKHKWFRGNVNNNELPGNENMSIWFMKATDCWVDGVTILNSADYSLRCIGKHITLRDLYVDGVFNKHGGAHGYFFLLDGSSHNLVTETFVTHHRHISLQGDGVEYNVLYGNNFEQEVSFHSGDDGNNLIENNKITLPSSMPGRGPTYVAIMGPWSIQHDISSKPNYIYKNICVENNHNGARPWNDDRLYDGPYVVKPNPDDLNALWNNFRPKPNNKTPIGGTLYPVMLDCKKGAPCDDGDDCTVNDVIDEDCNCVGTDSGQDSDNDTVCDAIDQCPDFDDRLIGTPCDDNNRCTINDVYTSNCICEGEVAGDKIEINPKDDSFLQGGSNINNDVLRLEAGNRVSYLKFDLSGITKNIKSIALNLTVGNDSGNGVINIYKSNNVNWTENNLSVSNAPTQDDLVGTLSGNYTSGNSYSANLNISDDSKLFSLIMVHQGGNDVSFVSNNANSNKPKLIVETENCILSTSDLEEPSVFSIKPNPVNEKLQVSFSALHQENTSLSILNTLGARLYNKNYDTTTPNEINNESINVSSWSPGLYFVILQQASKRKVLKLIVK